MHTRHDVSPLAATPSSHSSTQDDSKLHLVLDYVRGGELFFHLRQRGCFLEHEARFYVAEVSF